MARMGKCGGTLRLPLAPLAEQHHAVLEKALRDAQVL
jgi:4-hydroxy-tetrahydrodipicolinate synthase